MKQLNLKVNKDEIDQDDVSYSTATFYLLYNSLPSIGSMIIEYSLFTLNIIFVGFLDDPVLMSGCGIGGVTAYLTIFLIGMGICGGIETLVSQAYGRGEYYLCKLYLNVSRILITLIFIAQLVLIFYSEEIFILIGQPHKPSYVAWRYLMILIPGFFFNLQFECTKRYLLAIGVYYPPTIVLLICLIIHIVCLVIFTFQLKLGIDGVGMATSITYTLSFILISLYTQLQSNPIITTSWNFIDPKLIECFPEFLRFGVKSIFALFLFLGPFELTIIYGGWLGLSQSIGSTILNSISMVISEIPYGMAITASSIVGNNLGANLPNRARIFSHTAYMIGIVSSFVICIILLVLKRETLSIYTNNLEVIELINSSMHLFLVSLFFYLINSSVNSVLRGMGYQGLLVIYCFLSYWVITLPLSLALILHWNYNFNGIWIGLGAGNLSFMLFISRTILFVDWKALAKEKSQPSEIQDKEESSAKP